MLHIWCDANFLHIRSVDGELCSGCDAVLDYASHQLFICPYGEEKPTCQKCRIHCYTNAMRELMKDVVRVAGWRLLFRRPVLAFRNMCDAKRVTPRLEKKQARLGSE